MKTYWTHMCPDLVLSFVFFIIITIISLFIESFIHSGPPMAPRGKKTTLIRKAHFGISFSPSLFSFSSSSISRLTRLILPTRPI